MPARQIARPRHTAALILLVLITLPAVAQERLTIWGTPPRENAHRTKAAEGFPPLPLPVVPQRRTEKKRPPAPPKLIANLGNFSFDGWKGSPGAVDQLLKNARQHLDVWYGWEQLDIGELTRKHTSGIDHRTPVVYMCAYYPLELTDEQRDALRAYVLGGGTLVINCCGQNAALASTEAEVTRLFPRYPLRQLPLDHPLYHAYHKIEQVKYPIPSSSPLDAGASTTGPPRLRAVTLGTRAAVIVSFEDLACGWNEWNNPSVKRVSAADSTRLGLNLITYVTAEQRYAKFLSETRDITGPSVRPRQQISFVQLIHDGNWNPNPSAVPFFLSELASNTSIAVDFTRQTTELKNPDLFSYPMLYMTGSWSPGFSDEEIAILRRFLTNGGVLIADAAAGRAEFDEAFRTLCARLFPDHALTPLPLDHALYHSFYDIAELRANHEQDPITPELLTITLADRPAIIYSPLGLSDGWSRQFSAYARAYATPDALKLGTNILIFAMQ
ncbi:MAG: DUF4159 domain-containing protein [Phycisphaerae bacterium]|nr:DUF4159 domain-containing protein [Phycisphaerae bacterium]